MGPSWALLRWRDGPAIPAPNLPGLVVIDLLRAEEDFLSPPGTDQRVLRDVQAVLQNVLDSAQAAAVLVRPDRYVCAYLDGSAPNLAQLHSLLQSQGMANQSLKA
jgi:3-(3-hydroxy-phenyl)propionate hydroxylase